MLYTPISRTLHVNLQPWLADWLHTVGQYFTCRVASLEAASRMVWTFIKLNEGLAHDGFDAHWLSTATEMTQNKAWSSIFYQAWCCCSSICTAVGCFLNLEGFKERCPQLIPLLPDHHTLVSNKLAAIHHPIRLQLVPQPLRKVPHVLTQVELLMRFETGPRHQAEMFASCNSDRVFTRLALRDHGVPAIEALQSQDRVHVGISGSQVPNVGAVQHSLHSAVEHISESREKRRNPSCPFVFRRAEHKDRTVATVRRIWQTAHWSTLLLLKSMRHLRFGKISVQPVLWQHGKFVIDAVLKGVMTVAEKNLSCQGAGVSVQHVRYFLEDRLAQLQRSSSS